jgi:hypothetical protein
MSVSYTVIIYDSAGTRLAYSDDMLEIGANRVVNGIDIISISYLTSANAVQYLTADSIVELYRQDPDAGIASYREFSGIVREVRRTVTDSDITAIRAVGFIALLADRIVAYRAGVANRTVFSAVPAETILKTLFDYNLGSNATTGNGRLLSGVLTGATTSASAGTGNVISIACHADVVLSAMQAVQEVGGGDFDIIYTAPASYAFTWYLGQRGTDRTASVIFSVPNGSISALVTSYNSVTDTTAAIVGGQGEGVDRVFSVRPTALPTGLGLRETWVDARNSTTLAEYQQRGDITLEEATRRRSRIEVAIAQTQGLRYGRDYFLGDLVSIDVGGILYTRKILSVAIRANSDGSEEIDVGLTPQ